MDTSKSKQHAPSGQQCSPCLSGTCLNARPFGYIDSRYVQNASYLKLRNLTIGYTLKVDNLKLKVKRVHFYATASNLFTITPYKGYDPEVSSGTDSGAYPASRTFTYGVNVTL